MPHLLAILDRSNACCDGGYLYEHWELFSDPIADAFPPLLESGAEPPSHWDFELLDLWKEAQSEWTKNPDGVWIDPYIWMRVVSDLFDDTDAWIFDSTQVEEAMPGRDWVTDILYAKDPKNTVQQALDQLHKLLIGPSKL